VKLKELIEKLKGQDQEAEVLVDAQYSDYPYALESVEVEDGNIYLRDWGGCG
jgi:hypothetical protein